MNNKRANMNKGAAALFIVFTVIFIIVFARFLTIQITGEVDQTNLAAKAASRYLRSDVLEAKRGTILDRNGQIIAEDIRSYKLVAILDKKMTVNPKQPNHVADPKMTAKKIAKYIDMPESDIYKRLTMDERKQVEFGAAGNDIPNETKRKIEALRLPGITFISSPKRFYPNGTFASHLVGYAQKKETKSGGTEIQGKMGAEQSLHSMLAGKNGKVEFDADLYGYLLPEGRQMVQEPKNGQDVYLTLDKTIQTFLEDAMSKVAVKYEPKKIFAVVADPKTGEILAMGQRPTFNPMTREGIEQSWHNEVIETSYEPGSTMKIFTLAAAVETGVFNPNATYMSGTFKVGPSVIKDHNRGNGWGRITYLEGVQRSSNVAFTNLLDLMGRDKYREYLDRFHFGQKTGVNLPNETSGKILYQWPIEKYTTTFGQGTTVNALQMVQAATAVANDGTMMKPYVIDKVYDPNTKKMKETKPQVAGKPISDETAKKVREYLRTSLTNKKTGTAVRFEIPGYDVTGKTGTAQIPGPNGKYLEGWDNYIFSFLGMAPKDDPKLIVYVAVEQPKLDIEKYENGAVPVQMIFNPVMQNSLQYLNIKPASTPVPKVANLPDVAGMDVEKAKALLEKERLNVIMLGNGGKVKHQLPEAGSVLLQGGKVFIKTDGAVSVPNMKGWSKQDVMKVADMLSLRLNMIGDGYAAKQNLKTNSPVKAEDLLVVTFTRPEPEKVAEPEDADSPLPGQATEELPKD